MRGIEPRAFHMQSERSTTELHPPCSITVFCFYGYPTTSERQTPWGCCNFADSCEHWYGTRLNYYYVAAIYLFFVLSLLSFLLSLIHFSIQWFFLFFLQVMILVFWLIFDCFIYEIFGQDYYFWVTSNILKNFFMKHCTFLYSFLLLFIFEHHEALYFTILGSNYTSNAIRFWSHLV